MTEEGAANTERRFRVWIRRRAEPQGPYSVRFEVTDGKGILRVARPGVLIDPPARPSGFEERLTAGQVRASRFLHVWDGGRYRQGHLLARLDETMLDTLPLDRWVELLAETDGATALLVLPGDIGPESGRADDEPTWPRRQMLAELQRELRGMAPTTSGERAAPSPTDPSSPDSWRTQIGMTRPRSAKLSPMSLDGWDTPALREAALQDPDEERTLVMRDPNRTDAPAPARPPTRTLPPRAAPPSVPLPMLPALPPLPDGPIDPSEEMTTIEAIDAAELEADTRFEVVTMSIDDDEDSVAALAPTERALRRDTLPDDVFPGGGRGHPAFLDGTLGEGTFDPAVAVEDAGDDAFDDGTISGRPEDTSEVPLEAHPSEDEDDFDAGPMFDVGPVDIGVRRSAPHLLRRQITEPVTVLPTRDADLDPAPAAVADPDLAARPLAPSAEVPAPAPTPTVAPSAQPDAPAVAPSGAGSSAEPDPGLESHLSVHERNTTLVRFLRRRIASDRVRITALERRVAELEDQLTARART